MIAFGPESEAGSSAALPKYEQLRAHLLKEVREGRIRAGDLLPTENELAISAKMSRNTVRQALGNLERDGLIRRIRGRGTYIHESALQRLKSGLDIFALLIPDTRGGYYPSLQRGFHEASSAIHNQVIISDTGNDPLRQADALLQLMDQKITGVALVPTTDPVTRQHQIRPVQEQGIPVVFCHRRVEGIKAPLVTFSPSGVGELAAQTLAGAGHRRIAMFSGQRAGFGEQYEKGLRAGAAKFGASVPDKFVCYGNSFRMTEEHQQFLEASLKQLLAASNRPTAIFCTFDSDAELIYLLLTKWGVAVPETISLVGFGGTWRNGPLAQRLTSVVVDEEELGRKAAGLLDEMRRHERPLHDITEFTMPLSLSQGETLGAAPEIRSK